MLPTTANFTERSEPTAENLGVILGIEFALRFSLLSSRPLAVATASPPKKVLLGDFEKSVYLIQKELDQDGKFTGANLPVTLTVGGGYIAGERLCKAYFDNESQPSATASVSVTSLGGSTYAYSADIGITSNRTLTRLDMIIGGTCNTGNVNYCLTGLNVPLRVGKQTTLTTSLHTAAEYNSCNTTTNNFYTVQAEQNVGPVGTGMGLVYFGARYYDPEIGVWTSTDPKGQYWSPYSYVGGNPALIIDPNGEFGWVAGLIGGAAIGGTIGFIAGGLSGEGRWDWQNALIGYGIGTAVGGALGVGFSEHFGNWISNKGWAYNSPSNSTIPAGTSEANLPWDPNKPPANVEEAKARSAYIQDRQPIQVPDPKDAAKMKPNEICEYYSQTLKGGKAPVGWQSTEMTNETIQQINSTQGGELVKMQWTPEEAKRLAAQGATTKAHQIYVFQGRVYQWTTRGAEAGVQSFGRFVSNYADKILSWQLPVF
jgi:RHS repeat-associated protein